MNLKIFLFFLVLMVGGNRSVLIRNRRGLHLHFGSSRHHVVHHVHSAPVVHTYHDPVPVVHTTYHHVAPVAVHHHYLI
ncbi:hypothetical protein TcasGA2_TC034659 [Tribolium castaneum]|uniref:Uncharacterized protein n=1 Tax=Tribolium castaneum TaxID=7070 RepID=A0A139WJM8_TRICA|nr:hypothetical protein TcasGA2_TC034659 [Tribolium castaneum]